VIGARAALVTAAAALVFLFSGSLLHHAWWGRHQLVDTPVYERYGDAIAAGQVPYRDFSLEYPPGALAAFVAPELTANRGDFGAYAHAFEKWMAGCGVALALLVGTGLWLLRAPLRRAVPALALVAFSPLLLGSVMLSRFDLLPAALTAATMVALLAGWNLVAVLVLGLAIAVKLYPAVLVPFVIAWIWKREGRRRALAGLGLTAFATAVVVLPFAVLSPDGLGHSLSEQLRRPDQIESLASAFLLAAHHLAGLGLEPATSHGSQNLLGGAATAAGTVSVLLGLVTLALVWTSFARGPATRSRLLIASGASVAAVVAFSRVFSPQFLLWLLPLVALAPSGTAMGLLGGAMVLTQVWFPKRYWELALTQRPFESWLVLARDLLVVAIVVVLVRPLLQDNRLRERRAVRKPLEPVRGQVET
jgi:hypothetical protein